MADYDAGDITDRERTAANNLGSIASFNAQSAKNQLAQTMGNYDIADKQNRQLADVQRDQNSRKAASERFGQNKKLQATAKNLLTTMGPAMNGSSVYNLNDMLRTRTDLDNAATWETLTDNWNAVENAYNESLNANVLARNDAASTAEKSLRDINADIAAQSNNINPNLFQDPNSADNSGYTGTYDANKRDANMAKLSGYIMPDQAAQQARQVQQPNRLNGNDYFSMLMNSYNRR